MYIKLDKEYEIKCTLGTIKDIERNLGKGFFELIGDITKTTTEDQIKMLYAGVKRANPSLSFDEFNRLCEENLGIGDLTDLLEKFFYSLQYPGLPEEEVQQKIEKKLQRNKEIKSGRA